jgi:hypothetical protein
LLTRAALASAHAVLCEQAEWALNEKLLLRRAGVEHVKPILAAPGMTARDLGQAVIRLRVALSIAP